jgi:DNA-directed RNA polymerase subunit RPC12/RpoP
VKTTFLCSNCRFQFEGTEGTVICPRCSSKRIAALKTAGAPIHSGEKKFHSPYVYRDGKDGWKDFHSSDIKQCTECGGTDFELNWKRKEKTCKNCGNVMPLPRRVQ